MKTPELKPGVMRLDIAYVNKLLGMDFSINEVKNLLEKMRYGAESGGNKLTVEIPPYRTDVLHPMDLVEDVAIAYGYENFKPERIAMVSTGRRDPMTKLSDKVRDPMIGLGFQEVMTLTLTNKTNLFNKMELPEDRVVETENPASPEHSVVRNWLIPSLMSVLERNKNREYPQKLFEIGNSLDGDGKETIGMAMVIAHSNTNLSEIKSISLGLLETLGLKYKIRKLSHGSFIEGRCASTDFCFFGEIHPRVLSNFGLEVPVTAAEFDITKIHNSY